MLPEVSAETKFGAPVIDSKSQKVNGLLQFNFSCSFLHT